jgi:hypothetical protein
MLIVGRTDKHGEASRPIFATFLYKRAKSMSVLLDLDRTDELIQVSLHVSLPELYFEFSYLILN